MTLTEVANLIEETLRKNNDKYFGIRVDNYEYRDGEQLEGKFSCIVPDNEASLREVLEYPGNQLHLISSETVYHADEEYTWIMENPTVVASWEIFDSLDEPQAKFLKYTMKFNKLIDDATEEDWFADYRNHFYYLRGSVELYIRDILNQIPDLFREADDVLVLYDEDLHREIKKDFEKLAGTVTLAETLARFHEDPVFFTKFYFEHK